MLINVNNYFIRFMAFITFMSDFGNKDHYVAALKAKILSFDPNAKIIDISHHIEHFNIAHGSFVLKSVFKEFPEGSVHIAALNAHDQQQETSLALKLEGHYFVGPDNGLFGLLSDQEPEVVVKLRTTHETNSFPAKNTYAEAAVKLSQGAAIHELGEDFREYKRLIGRAARATKKQISGHVIHVDTYGNLITNIEKRDFDILSRDKKYSVIFGRESLRKIHGAYNLVDPGDCFLLFNDLGLLEIGIFKGNASELLGLGYDSPVNIVFEE